MTPCPRDPETVETRDVRARPLFLAGLGLVVGVAVSAGLVALVIGMLGFHKAPPAAPATGPAAQGTPRLQVTPAEDRLRVEARSRRLLEEQAWLDAGHTHARIPIDRAMDILAARGWPDAEDKKP